ncbi:MAG: hypothetical protein J6K31_06500 [Parabacteroides sp.]|nr:hypothetical protein [Parabacteroides sp.]
MNKKFSTLVATLLLSGALFTLNAEEAVTPSAVSKWPDKVTVVETGEEGSKVVKSITFAGDVTLESGQYLLVKDNDVVIDGAGKTLNGFIVITGNNCTVKNLKINHVSPVAKGIGRRAIDVIAEGVTITGCEINCGNDESENLTNGIAINPTAQKEGAEKAKITITGNKFKGFVKTTEDGDKTWSATGLMIESNAAIATDYAALWTDGKSAPTAAADFENITLTISGNTFENCIVDYVCQIWDTDNSTIGEVIGVQISPLYNNDKTEITNGDGVTDYAKLVADGVIVKFNGSADELAKALESVSDKGTSPVQTKDGVVSTVAPAEEEVAGYILATKPESDGYYVLAFTSGDKIYYVSDAKGSVTELSDEAEITETALWKMEPTLDKDGDYTFIFKNKKDETLTVGGNGFLQSAVKGVPYGVNGVPFALKAEDGKLATTDDAIVNFGLYKAGIYTLTAKDLYFFEKTGFTITIDGKLAGDPFTGNRLAPMSWNGTEFVNAADNEINVSLRFKNADDEYEYIVAKKTNAGGTAVNQYVYAFTTVSEKDLIAERKKEAKKRTMFDVFTAFHKPVSASDNLETLTSIDSITVQVLNKDDILEAASVGYFKLTTDGTKTLGASIDYKLFPITIKMGNNVVDPAAFLQKKFFTITRLDEKNGDRIYAVNGCGNRGWVKEAGNILDTQWAVTYDEEAAEYTFTNRENKAVSFSIAKNQLRENGDKTDDIYTDGEKLYKIVAVEGEVSDGYNWLGDVKNQRFHIAHYSSVYENNAWISADKDGNAILNLDEDAAVEFVANKGRYNSYDVDTVFVVSKLGYYDGTKFTTEDNTLKVPVYRFFNVAGQGFQSWLRNDKYSFANVSDDAVYPLAIRENGDDKYNLRSVGENESGKLGLVCQKIYAGTSTNFLSNCGMYEVNNSLFVIEPLDRPEYRRLGETVANDGFKDLNVNLAKFFRTNVENTFLYENSLNRNANNGNGIAKDSLNFLGEVNLADKPASAALPLFVDTAFVRNDVATGEPTTKPLYMLAVRNTDMEEDEIVVEPCDATNHQHITADGEKTDDASKCVHATTKKVLSRKAEYLVALTDTAYNTSNKQALYQYNVRLAFVPATHFENDTLVIASSRYTGTKDAAKDTLSFVNEKGEQQMNAATFAFRLVDPAAEDGAFYIEAEPNAYGYTQYVRIHNSVPVLVTSLDQAATFNVEATDEAATSNEGIATSEVKVIAGEGQVTIAGAAGKKVVISNILGQVVANTVLVSDNAVIAAPQGVVVVAVEGEEAVKAIVK